MRALIVGILLGVCAMAMLGGPAQADPVRVTADEYGNGTVTFYDPGPPPTPLPLPLPFEVAADPMGLSHATLGYSLAGAPTVVIGDLILTGPGGAWSDVIRFTDNLELVTWGVGPGPGFLFYSDENPGPSLADTGLPSVLQANIVLRSEYAEYTPGTGQPGYVDGWDVTYRFTSDPVIPLPSAALMGMTLLAGAIGARRLSKALR